MNLNHPTNISPQMLQYAGTVQEVTGNGQDNEYARLNQLLSALAKTTHESMEEIQHINMKMRMISFNSKIEAARAGEAGKAFSIVSDEMKILSDQTATVARNLRLDNARSTGQLKNIFEELSTQVRGTRLSDLALTNIDLIDRNLYERSCDVRWWATDSSLVTALEEPSEENNRHAAERLGVILNAYTVYFDLVLCDGAGNVVANGRAQQYRSSGMNMAATDWFRQAMESRSGDHYGFQSVHASPLVKGQRVLMYSAAVRGGGKVHGKAMGALGIVFNYDALAQVIMRNTPISASLKAMTRVCITDAEGLVLADSAGKILQDTLEFPEREQLYEQEKGYLITELGSNRCCIAHARAPGYETYSTGWHSVIMQTLG
ncbi:MAG: cache domain-containing protein [Pseudomonadota bacterium]